MLMPPSPAPTPMVPMPWPFLIPSPTRVFIGICRIETEVFQLLLVPRSALPLRSALPSRLLFPCSHQFPSFPLLLLNPLFAIPLGLLQLSLRFLHECKRITSAHPHFFPIFSARIIITPGILTRTTCEVKHLPITMFRGVRSTS